jgi:hypothetical protein
VRAGASPSRPGRLATGRERSRGVIIPGVGAGNHPSQPISGSSEGSALTTHQAGCHTGRRAAFRTVGLCSTFAPNVAIGSEDGSRSTGHVGRLLGEAIARAIVAASNRTCPAEGRTGIAHLLEEGRRSRKGFSRSLPSYVTKGRGDTEKNGKSYSRPCAFHKPFASHLTGLARLDRMRGSSAGTIEDTIEVGPGATKERPHVPCRRP